MQSKLTVRAREVMHNFIISVALVSSAFTTTAGEILHGSSFARSVSLHDDLDLYWTADLVSGIFRLAIHSKTVSGWVGFGISEMGGMEGADIMFYEYESNSITDAHSIVAGMPIVDECTQDWTLVSADIDGDGMVVFVERPLDTSDAQDWAFVDDSVEGATPARIFSAWGDEDSVSYHGSNVAQATVYLFSQQGASDPDPLVHLKANDQILAFDVVPNKFLIPTTTTWYEDTCFPTSVLPMGGEFHAVGFEGLLDNATADYVHHLVLKGYYDVDCGNTSNVYADIFFWAHGVLNMALPDDVGFRFGEAEGGFKSVALQTHYNNPNGDVGRADSSGIRVYFSKEPLAMDAGALQLGDPYVSLFGDALPDGKSRYTFSCPASCTSNHFELTNVTVFQHSLHMHSVGQRAETRHYRNGELIRTLAVDYYSFLQAGGYVVGSSESGTLQAGDYFETDCIFDTTKSRNDEVYFGLGSDDEMCIDFVFYYPAQPMPFAGMCGPGFCGGEFLGSVELEDESDFNRIFGIVETCPNATTSDIDEATDEASGAMASRGGGVWYPVLPVIIVSLSILLQGLVRST